jgi:hypothetical protein
MVDNRLSYYRQQASKALHQAERCTHERERDRWMQLAADWQNLYDGLSRQLGLDPKAAQPPTAD